MTRCAVIVVLAALFGVLPHPATAQPTEELLRSLRKDIETLKEGQAAMQRELQEIKNLIRTREAPAAGQAPPPEQPQNMVLSLDAIPFKGDGKARLVLVDFTDYQ
jgi:type II secretory pathway component PulM